MEKKVSILQSKFPLSRRKFWKKLISDHWWTVFLALLWVLFINFALSITLDEEWSGLLIERIIYSSILVWIIIIPLIIYIKKYISNYYYEWENEYLTIRKWVFTSTEIHVPYNKIQDVYVDQDIFDRFFFWLYDVHISSATAWSAMEAHIDGVDEICAEWLKEYILTRMKWGENKKEETKIISPQEEFKFINNVLWTQNISNTTYPLSAKWFLVNTLNIFLSSITTALLIALYIFIREDWSTSFWSVIEKIGLSNSIIWIIWVIVIVLTWAIIYTRLFKKNYKFEFLKDYIQQKTGILSRSESNVPYQRIQDVTIQQSFIERIVWIYNVNIANASQWNLNNASDVSLVWLSKTDAETISNLLRKQVFWDNKNNDSV